MLRTNSFKNVVVLLLHFFLLKGLEWGGGMIVLWTYSFVCYFYLFLASISKEFFGVSEEFWLNPPCLVLRAALPILFLPYRFALSVLVPLSQLFFKENWVTEVAPKVYLGARAFFWNRTSYERLGIQSVLNVCGELPENGFVEQSAVEIKTLYILDNTAPKVKTIDSGVQFVEQALAQGRTVYVHCAYGHGRSATLVAALFISRGLADSVTDAEKKLKAKRSGVRLNPKQREALETWLRAWREHRQDTTQS